MRSFMVLFACFSMCALAIGAGPAQLVAELAERAAGMPSVHFKANTVIRADSGSEFGNTEEWKIDFRRKMTWGTSERSSEYQAGGVDRKRTEMLFTPEYQIQSTVHSESSTTESSTAYLNPSDNYWEERVVLSNASNAFGLTNLDGKLTDIHSLLTNATKEIAPRRDNEVTLLCSTPKYRITLSLNKENRGISHFELVAKVGESKDTTVYEVAEWLNGVLPPTPRVFTYIQKIPKGRRKLPDGTRWIDGGIVITEGKKGSAYMPIPEKTKTFTVTMNHLQYGDLDADSFELQAKRPDGSRVNMVDAHHLEFAWLNNQIVPRVDAMAALNRRAFMPARRRRAVAFVCVSLVAVAFLGWYAINRQA